MLQDRYETDKLFRDILKLTNTMDPVLAQIDQLLEDEVLYQWPEARYTLIRQDLAQRYPQTEQTGRNSMPVEVILRMLAVKRLYGLSYERGGESAQSEGKVAYQKLVRAARATIRQAEQVLTILQVQATPECQKLAETLDTFIPRAKQVVDQTVRRVFEQEKVPAAEKMVSIFEPHTDIIRRNKARKPTEYGHKIWLDEVDGGMVTRWQVLEGNPSDEKQWLSSLDHHQARFGKPPDQASDDRGLYSPQNERIAAERGVKRVILPRPGKKSPARKQHERQPWFVRGR
jgi:IS5 family transposase